MNKMRKEIILSATSGVEESQPGMIKQRYRFRPDFIGFSGHFPGNPILPAFVQILTALTLTEIYKGRPLKAASVEKAKFRIPLQPEQEIEVACRQLTVGKLTGCDARLTVSEGLAASFRISFLVKEDSQ
jgi:3-hydroxyacyl-[acyl-carrier-protein] dehydratase